MLCRLQSFELWANRHATIVFAMCVLVGTIGCGSDESAENAIAPEIQIVDGLLSQSYSDHFPNIQGDYTVAEKITSAIQIVIDKSDRESLHLVLPLLDKAVALLKNQSEANYLSLKNEWDASKTKINFKKISSLDSNSAIEREVDFR